MQRLEVSGAVRHIYVIRRQRVNQDFLKADMKDNKKGKAVPLQAWSGPEGSRKLRFPDFMTTAQDGGKLSALCTGRLYPQAIHLVLISFRG
jgi:hypothetical protein